MRLGEVIAALDGLAPTSLAESWDNVGLLVGDPDDAVERVLFTIDYTPEVAAEAETLEAGLVVCYHPPIFEPIRRLSPSSLIVRAIKHGIALYSPHTALDVAEGGTNDMLADVVGLGVRAPLRIRTGKEVSAGKDSAPLIGLGRIGTLPDRVPRADLVSRIKQGLGVERALVAGPDHGVASRVAVAAGACGDLYKDALAQGADLYLTGEMRHHDALACAREGMTVVCVLHSNSERNALRGYAERFALRATGLLISLSRADRDPFTIA